MKISTIAIAGMLLIGQSLFAVPRLDRDVQAFLNSDGVADRPMSVLITYKRNITIPKRPYHRSFHSEIQRALMQSTRAQEQALFQGPLAVAATKKRTYWILNGTAAELNRTALRSLSSHPNIASISNGRHLMRIPRPQVAPAPTPPEPYTYGMRKVGVPELRQKYPQFDGSGIRVGILDTGIDATHPDLVGKVVLYKDFTAANDPKPSDGHGHGTHCAGTIAGGSTSGTSIGVAPKASLVIGKIFDANGSTTDEALVAAMQWMADPDGDPATNDFPALVSNSWGDSSAFNTRDPQDDPFCMILENWVKLGILPVFAAGNDGPDAGTVGTPGGCPMALTVGATDSRDGIAPFSSRGPAKWKSNDLFKPNVSAPGVAIRSAKPGGGYQLMSGTSMATPHVAGVMAILYQANPKMTVDEAGKAVLAGVADLGVTGPDMFFGAGRVDVTKSVDTMKQNY